MTPTGKSKINHAFLACLYVCPGYGGLVFLSSRL